MTTDDYQRLALQVKNRAILGHVAEAGGLIEDAVNKAVAAARGSTETVAKLMDAQVAEIKYLRAALAKRDEAAKELGPRGEP